MGNIAGIDVGLDMPSFVNSSFGFYLIVALIFIGFISVGGFGMFMIYLKKLYNRKVVVFENIAGQGWVKSFDDSARLLKIGTGGEEILYLRKRKVYRTAYGKKMGKNTFWFAIGQDGYWYNFILGDLDAKMGMLDIEPIDRDMRYMHVAIRKNTQDRYLKTNFMEKYGTMLMLGIYMLGFFIGTWFLLDQLGEIATQLSSTIGEMEKVVKPMTEALGRVDSICSGGSGVRPS